MNRCPKCQSELLQYGQFCQICGATIAAPHAMQQPVPHQRVAPPNPRPENFKAPPNVPVPYRTGGLSAADVTPSPLPDTFYGRMVRGFAGLFDLHEKVASATILVDVMIFGGTVVTVGIGWPVMAMAALGLMFVAFTGQINWQKDDAMSAATKAALVGILTAIPVPIATALALFMGLKRGKK